MAEKKSFVLYTDSYEQIEKLNEKQKAELLDAIFIYASTGKFIKFNDFVTEIVFGFIRQQIERDNEKYKAKKEKNAAYYRSKKNSENSVAEKSEKTCKTDSENSDSDTDTDTDTVTVNGNDTVNVNVKGVIGGKDKPSPRSPVKKKYGNFQHIALTDEQYKKLLSDYGQATIEKYIQAIDDWVQLKGKGYKDYNLAIRKWIAKDDVNSQPKDDFDVDKYKAFVNQF